jgi:uncharacterized protein
VILILWSEAGISVNTVSAFFHDHLFVPAGQAEETVEILCRMAADAKPEG